MVEEGNTSVELTLSLSQAVPFNTSLELRSIDDTTTSELCSVNNDVRMYVIIYLIHCN